MDQILPDRKNLQGLGGQCVVARDKDQDRGTSEVSDWATSTLVVCKPECHQCDNAAFRRRRQGSLTALTKQPFAEFPLHRLELVGKLGLPYPPH